MSVTRETAAKWIMDLRDRYSKQAEKYEAQGALIPMDALYPYIQALDMALSALRHQEWEEQLWHDAKSDPPKTPGLYYGKKDDTNSMYACQYRDGVWVLDMYPQQKMEIMQWADYTAFAREGE